MRISFWPGPGTPWPELLETCLHAEATGWDGLWFADHFMPLTGDLSKPVNECWTTLAALAARVPRVRLGSLVCGNTYRHPAVLANMAAGVDRISGGRFVLGLGAGWQENEHRAYGLEFPELGERLDRLEEACQVVKQLTTSERSSFAGRHYRLADAPLEPKPEQEPLPLLVGGGGEKRTLRIAARYADEWNCWGTPEIMAHKGGVLDRHCAEVGREPAAIGRSAAAMLQLTDVPVTEDARRGGAGPAMLIGDAGQLGEELVRYVKAGVDELIVPDFNLGRGVSRRDTMDRIQREVVGPFRADA